MCSHTFVEPITYPLKMVNLNKLCFRKTAALRVFSMVASSFFIARKTKFYSQQHQILAFKKLLTYSKSVKFSENKGYFS